MYVPVCYPRLRNAGCARNSSWKASFGLFLTTRVAVGDRVCPGGSMQLKRTHVAWPPLGRDALLYADAWANGEPPGPSV